MKYQNIVLVIIILWGVTGCLCLEASDAVTCTDSCRDGLACLNNTCQYCQTNSQCQRENSQTVCTRTQYMGVIEYLCLHKPLFGYRFSSDDLISFIIFFVAAAVSAGGGVGGGGIFIPILILVAKFLPKQAVPLSNIIVAGASVANFVQNYPKKHPHIKRPLIDYTVALLIEPQTLGGTVVGVYLHQIFPSWLILLLLIIVMSLTTIRTTLKGISLYKSEKVQHSLSENAPLINSTVKIAKTNEKPTNPWSKIILLIIILIVSSALSVLKGGDGDTSIVGIVACTPWYWVTAMGIFPVIFLIWGYEGYAAVKNTRQTLATGTLMNGEVVWTPARIVGVGTVSFLAGIIASLLGVGGGLIKGPVLIEIGLPPEVVAATSSYMILFTSVSASIQYIVIGKIMWDYGVVLFAIGLVASFAGQTLLNIVVAKYKRKSYIIFVIAFVIGISAILLVVSEVVELTQTGGNNSFTWSCPD